MRLKELRKARKIRQTEVAEVLSCSQGVYSRYESGEREPPFDILVRLADFYGVTVDYLMGRDVASPTPIHEQQSTPADREAEAKRILEGLNEKQYQEALTFLKFLQSQK